MSKKGAVRRRPRARTKKIASFKPLPIVADANAYGTYGRISALADFLEVCALKKLRVRKQQLADMIGDNGWQLRDLMVNPSDEQDPDVSEDPEEDLPVALDLADDAADRVFSTIRERADILGSRYPFRIYGERVMVKAGVSLRRNPYIAVLAITVAHTFKLSSDPDPTKVLEDLVGDMLKKRLRLGINFGRIRRDTSPFLAAVEKACPAVKLKYSIPDLPISKRAQDENVDTIAHLHWGDRRPGTWCFIGQVTCAKSDDWEQKLDEPKPATWGPLLGVVPHPMVFLAVPHHVEEGYLEKLVSSQRGIVLDRLRLTMNMGEVAGDKRRLVRKMLTAKMDAF
jgi:hypothetical protein